MSENAAERTNDPRPPDVAETGSVRGKRKRGSGVVISDRGNKTITVASTHLVKHPRYGKYLRRTTKYMAHDEENAARTGDQVEIMETRPLSRRKRWRLIRIVEQANRPAEASSGAEASAKARAQAGQPAQNSEGAQTDGDLPSSEAKGSP